MDHVLIRALSASVLTLSILPPTIARGAEATTGAIVGTVRDQRGAAVANARVNAASASGRYSGVTDASGRYALLGVVPDTYAVSVTVSNFTRSNRDGVVVLAGSTQSIAFVMSPELRTIATVRSTSKSFALGSTADTFTVNGAAARAMNPTSTSSGQANYLQGTVQGAIAAVPGVDEDAFANAILRGGAGSRRRLRFRRHSNSAGTRCRTRRQHNRRTAFHHGHRLDYDDAGGLRIRGAERPGRRHRPDSRGRHLSRARPPST